MNRRLILGLTAAVLIAGACGGTATKDSTSAGGQQAAGQPAPSVTASAAPKPTGPWVSFADGTYEVGTTADHVAPGKYKATVPADSIGCYWSRLKDTSGEVDSIIANGLAKANEPVTITIAAKDGAFKTERCGTWAKIG